MQLLKNKSLKAGKCSLAFIIACLFAILVPLQSYAAGQNNKLVSLNYTNGKLSTVLKDLERQSNVRFVYNANEVQVSSPVTISAKKEQLGSVLNRLLSGYTWAQNGNQITISKIAAGKSNTQGTVHGRVLDNAGKPIMGVNVYIKGTTIGVETDDNGEYDLKVTKGNVIVYYFLGFKTKEIAYNGQTKLNVVLEEDSTELDNLVVTGYQVIDRRNLTSAITSLKAEDIMVPGVTSIDQMLEGRVPEMTLTMNSGEVGTTPRLRVRGTSTLLGSREPLWVLDGIVMTDPVDVDPDDLNNPDYINIIGNAIAGVNPQDIDRIDVLKDASATALYGTRAANGVIVVTTKSGKKGKPVFSYNHTSKFTRRPRYTDRNINLMNSQERVAFGKSLADQHYVFPTNMPDVGYEGALNQLQTGKISYSEFADRVAWYETVNTDWFDLLTRDAYSHSHSLRYSGGSDIIRYYTSLGYDRENGVSNTTYNERYTASAKMDVNFTKKFNVGIKFNGNVQKRNNLAPKLNVMDYAYNTTRALPSHNDDNTLFYYDRYRGGYSGNGSRYLRYNILNEIDNSSNGYDGKGFQVDLNMRYNIMPTWDITATSSYSVSSTVQEEWWGEKSAYIAALKNGEYDETPLPGKEGKCALPYGGILKTKNSDTENLTVRLQSNFRKLFGDNNQHLITALLGYEVSSKKSKSMNNEARGYLKDRGMQFVDMSSIDLDDYPLYKEWLQKNHLVLTRGLTNALSMYVSTSYGYNNYFTVNLNGRIDASNKFGSRSNERMLPVWSASAMVDLRELFMKGSMKVTELRFRASYGMQGNMLDGQTPNMLITQHPFNTYYEENTSTVSQFPNPNLKWEETQQTNLGLDLGFFESRLNVRSDFYYKKTSNVFSWVNVSTVNGLSSYLMNNGDVENIGYSISVSATPIRTRDFQWRVSTSYSANKNTVQTDAVENYDLNNYLSGTAIIGGESIGTFYSYKFLGLNPTNGTPLFDDYIDRKHLLADKSLEDVVKTVMVKSGTREPKFTGSFYNTLNWKNLTLSFNIACSFGSKVRLFQLYEPIIQGVSAENNVRKEFVNRWQVPGDELITNVPAIINRSDANFANYNTHWSQEQGNRTKTFANSLWNMYDNSDIRVVSGNYLKMSSLSLRYSFSRSMLKGTPLSAASISFNTQNLFTISAKELKGQDPSQAGFAKPNLSVRPCYVLQCSVSF